MTRGEERTDVRMDISKDTKVSAILREYGDIADVMELFGVERAARYSFRSFISKAVTVEMAARIHRVPPDEFLAMLLKAVVEIGRACSGVLLEVATEAETHR